MGKYDEYKKNFVQEKINRKQQLFVEKFIELKFNKTQAALAAGYSKKNPKVSADYLLMNPLVIEYLHRRQQELLEEIGVSQFRVLKELSAIAFADIRDFYKDGAMKNIDSLDENAAAAISCVDVFELFDNEGNKLGETKRLRMNDKLKALELLGRYLNMFEKDNQSKKPELNVYEVTLKLN